MKYIFVEHSYGDYEGNKYNNIILNDGLFAFKAKNGTGKNELGLKEGDTVKVDILAKGSKQIDQPKVTITSISKL